MPRQRERFERTDVPVASPRRNLIGAIVCVVALLATAIVVGLAWRYANLESHMGDHTLSDSVSSLAQYSFDVTADGYVETEDEMSYTLLLTASSLDEQGATLTGSRILAVDETAGTATLVTIPTDLALTVDEQDTTLAALFESQGYAACVVPLGSAAGLRFDNVILSTEDVLEEATELAGSGTDNLVSSASGFLSKIKTNLDAAELISFAETLVSIGMENLTSADAPLVAETATDEDGETTETGRQILDQTQLAIAVGRLVAA